MRDAAFVSLLFAVIASVGMCSIMHERDKTQCITDTYDKCTSTYQNKDCVAEARLVCVGTLGCMYKPAGSR